MYNVGTFPNDYEKKNITKNVLSRNFEFKFKLLSLFFIQGI